MSGEPAGSDLRNVSSALDLLEPGTLVRERYALLRYVGSGRVGSVYVARHAGFDETVALKFLRAPHLLKGDKAADVMRVARAGFQLRSAHIARVFDVDVHNGVPFLATELLEGATLRSVLDQHGALASTVAVDYALQTCEALACAHALGTLHLDLRPKRLFLESDQQIKVVDFGIVQLASTPGLESVAYMAPERARSAAGGDARSDIWSLGCVLYELLSGRAAFDREHVLGTCAAVLEEDPAEVEHLPDGLWQVIARCLNKVPEARFDNVAELACALEPFGSGRYSSYVERCRGMLHPAKAPELTPPPSAAVTVVSVQETKVLGQVEVAEPPDTFRKSSSRMATLAFDVSAFASPEEAVSELNAVQPPERPAAMAPTRDTRSTEVMRKLFADDQVHRPLEKLSDVRPSSPKRKGLLVAAALVCMALFGLALSLKDDKDRHPQTKETSHVGMPGR